MSHSPLAFIKLKILNATNKTKAILFNVSDSATASTTMTVESAHTADRTVTIPDITGTLESQANKGQANGYASLGSDSLVPAVQTQPDIQKYANLSSFPGTGSIKLIYMAQDTGKMYQWTGSAYTEVGGGTGAVSSFKGRTGAVVPATNDYTSAQVLNSIGKVAGPSVDRTIPIQFGIGGTLLQTTNVKIDNLDQITDLKGIYVDGDLHFLNSTGNGPVFTDGSQTLKIRAPTDIVADIVYKLPGQDGSNGDVLTTDGAGNLSFSSPSSLTFTEWTSFVVTASPVNGNIVYTGQYRRIGNALDIKYFVKVIGGTGSGNSIRFQIPPGFSIDTSKLSDFATNDLIELGTGTLNFVSTNYDLKGYFYDSSPDQITLYYLDHTTIKYTQMADNAPGSFASGVFFTLNCYGIPVV